MNAYYNVAEVEQACINLAAKYSLLSRLITLPNVTVEGRTSHALHLGTGLAGGVPKPVFMAVGALHGGEWGSCEIALNLAADLLGSITLGADLNYGPVHYTAAQVAALLAGIDFVVFPLVNPDGRHFSQQAQLNWRRNRNPQQATPGDASTIGVDLNRNFDFLFDRARCFAPNAAVSASMSNADENYQGAAAASEAETQNVEWLVKKYRPRWFVDLHSGKQGVSYPWSDDETQDGVPAMTFHNSAFDGKRGLDGDAATYSEHMPKADRDAHAALADVFCTQAAAVHARAYGHLPGFRFWPSAGTSHDWVYSLNFPANGNATRSLAFLVEWCGQSMRPAFPLMADIVQDVCAGLIAMAMAATGTQGRPNH